MKPAVTAGILAGGGSTRMGRDKALLPFRGRTLLDHQLDLLRALFPRVVVAGAGPFRARSDFEGVPDLLPERCALTGIHAALAASRTEHTFVVACDMPGLNPRLVTHLVERRFGADVVLPLSGGGPEPLHAVYSRACLPAVEACAARGSWKATAFHSAVRVREVAVDEAAWGWGGVPPFANANTPAEWNDLR